MEISPSEVSLCSNPPGLGPSHAPVPSPALAHISLLQTNQPDYILVADYRTQKNPRTVHKQRQFLEDLKGKGFQYKVGRHSGQESWVPGGSWGGVWRGCPWSWAWGKGARSVAVDGGWEGFQVEQSPARPCPGEEGPGEGVLCDQSQEQDLQPVPHTPHGARGSSVRSGANLADAHPSHHQVKGRPSAGPGGSLPTTSVPGPGRRGSQGWPPGSVPQFPPL